MTISRSIRKRLRRYALLCLVTASTAGFLETTPTSIAEDTHDSGDLRVWVEDLSRSSFSQESVAIRKSASQPPTPQFLTVSAEDQLTIDTCNFDTWLAGILPPSGNNPSPSDSEPAKAPNDAEPPASDLVKSNASRTSSQFNSTLATIAAAASAGNPIPLSQWTEPFAMIGPDGSHTPQEIKAFQAWFDNGKAFVAGLGNGDFNGFIPVVDFDGEVAGPPTDSLAVLDSQPARPLTDARPQTVARPLIGSSPVIATIEEAYQPYDLAAEDLAAASGRSESGASDPEDTAAADKPQDRQIVWTDGLFSPSLQPFCIHSLDLMRKPGWSPLAQKTIPSFQRVELPTEEAAVAEVEQSEPPAEAETLVAEAAVEAPAVAEPMQEEVVADVEPAEPPVEAETLVADAAVEAPAVAEPMQEEVVADVEPAEPPVEAETLVAEAAVEAPVAAEPMQEEVVADVEPAEPPVEAETLVAEAAVEAPAADEPMQEEVVADVEPAEPPVEAETLVADAAVEAPAAAEPMQEEVVADVEPAEPPVEAETLVADAAVEAPAAAEPMQEEVVAEVEQPEPPVEAETLVADAAVEAPAVAEPVQEEVVAEVEHSEPPVEAETLVADAAVEAPAAAEPVQEEVVAEVEQPESPVEAETLVADAAVEAPAAAEPMQEEVVAEVEQPEPPVEAETLVADAAVEVPAAAEPMQEEVIAEVEQPESPVEAETLVADAAIEAPVAAEPMQEEVIAEVEQAEPPAESMELVAANPSLPQGEVMVEEVPACVGSPDCLLEDVMWQVSVAMEDANVADQWLRPKRVGKRLASLVVGGDRVASRVAGELALVWPANAQPAKPIPGSGAKLLARAEAAEQLPAEGTAKPFTPEQLAQADAMFRQWVGVAQSVLDDLSDRLNDVTEVALHRGTQDDSERR
ncbi:hypothetical protein Enr13x_32340 [Stieleria neptunia]|uniref:Uncharacterized protein n=1 Tax=Stieleria neptunia TaxID=2527979 RepID=A0A518HRG2_9BACT|nr:hypothetical protein [Stieleria neptunia]QDV43378.1 hypothetical protein Enr13x_32340 [Stieleria neptunia]